MSAVLASPLASNIALLCSFAVQVGLFIAWRRALRRAKVVGGIKGLANLESIHRRMALEAIRDYTAGQKSGAAQKVHRMASEALEGGAK